MHGNGTCFVFGFGCHEGEGCAAEARPQGFLSSCYARLSHCDSTDTTRGRSQSVSDGGDIKSSEWKIYQASLENSVYMACSTENFSIGELPSGCLSSAQLSSLLQVEVETVLPYRLIKKCTVAPLGIVPLSTHRCFLVKICSQLPE